MAVHRVLIVEDQAERQDILQRLFRDHAWVLAHTAARAVRLVQAFSFDVIALDYDLAGPGCGDGVASAIAASDSAGALVIVHSMNAPGVARVLERLPGAVPAPISKITRDNATFKRLRDELARGTDVDWVRVFGRN